MSHKNTKGKIKIEPGQKTLSFQKVKHSNSTEIAKHVIDSVLKRCGMSTPRPMGLFKYNLREDACKKNLRGGEVSQM